MEEVVERIMKKPEGGDIVKGIFNNPEYRARIRMVFDDPREYAQFERALRSEGQMFETGAQALRNSRTFGRQAAAADLDSNIAADALDVASTAATGRGGGAFVVAKLGNWLKNWEQKKGGEKVRDEIARVMFKGSKAEQEALLMRLEAMGQYFGQRGGPSRILPTRGVPGSVPARPGVNPYVGGLLGVQATNDAPSLLGAPGN